MDGDGKGDEAAEPIGTSFLIPFCCTEVKRFLENRHEQNMKESSSGRISL